MISKRNFVMIVAKSTVVQLSLPGRLNLEVKNSCEDGLVYFTLSAHLFDLVDNGRKGAFLLSILLNS